MAGTTVPLAPHSYTQLLQQLEAIARSNPNTPLLDLALRFRAEQMAVLDQLDRDLAAQRIAVAEARAILRRVFQLQCELEATR